MFPPEPVVSAVLSKDIADELAKKYEVIVLCPRASRPIGYKFSDDLQNPNYSVVKLNSYTCAPSNLLGRLRESYSFGKFCSNYILENHTDIKCIYLNTWPLFAQFQVIHISKKLNIKTVIHIQDIYPESLTNKFPTIIRKSIIKLLLPLDKYILRNSSKIIGISPSMINYLSESRIIDRNKFELIRNWQDDSVFINNIPKIRKNKNFTFMFLGSISPSAGVMTIINSFNLANLNNTKLVIAGNGSDKENCIAQAHSLKNQNIEFCNVNQEDVSELQSQADVLLLPLKIGISKTATPSKLTAYLLSRKAIIAGVESDSDVANIIRNAACGYIVEPENIVSLSEMMKKAHSMDSTILESMGNAGYNYGIAHFSKKANLQKVISVIESTL